MTTFTRDEMEVACCLWEAMIELRLKVNSLDHAFRKHGVSEMRLAAVDLAPGVEEEWSTLTQDARDDIGPFDWEFCPMIVKRIDWSQWPPQLEP